MPAILRWFHYEGVRYHAYFRGLNVGGTADLILNAPGWQRCVRRDDVTRLEEFSDDELVSLVTALRTEEQAGAAL